MELANESDRAVSEVVQVYLHDRRCVASCARCSSSSGRPASTCRPGERRTVRFSLHADLTSFTGRDLVRVVEPGAVELRVGASSADIRAVLRARARRVLPPGRTGPGARARRGGLSPADARRLAARRAARATARRSPPRTTSTTFWDETLGPDAGPIAATYDAGGLRARRRRDLRRHVRWLRRRPGAGLAAPARSAAAVAGALPAVVQYQGYNGGRGLAHEHVFWATAGYAHLVVDTRGQGSGWTTGATGDPVGSGSVAARLPDPRDRGPAHLLLPRASTPTPFGALDVLRAHDLVDPSRVAVAGASQGGGIALATAALAPTRVAALLCDVPFLCDFRRAAAVAQTEPYLELVRYLAAHRDLVEHRVRDPVVLRRRRPGATRRRLLPCSPSR